MFLDFMNADDLNTLISFAALQTVALVSPGPDFAVVTRNSILHSRSVGVSTALGITAGILFHMSYLVFGFGVVVSHLLKYLIYVKVIGCAYLCYLGYKGLKAGRPALNSTELEGATLSCRSAFLSGFLTNVLNPKAILFLFSLFSMVVQKDTPQSILMVYAGVTVLLTLVWFLLVSLSFSGWLRGYFLRFSVWINRLTGGFLFFVGAKIGLTCFD